MKLSRFRIMKTILLATDFSRAGNKAAHLAANIAIKQQARLVLFHAYRFLNTYDDNYGLPIDEVKRISAKKLSDLKKRVMARVNQPLEIEVCYRHGSVIDTIKTATKEFEVDLIVMSSVGDSPLGAGFFGSAATEMIDSLKIPMLVLPPNYTIKHFENAVMGVDLSKPIDAAVLGKAIYFLRDLDTVVDVIYVAPNTPALPIEDIKKAELSLRELLKNVPHTFQTVTGKNQVETINSFVKSRNAQLLITFPKHHGFLEKIFFAGNTRRLVFDAEVPVLAIQ